MVAEECEDCPCDGEDGDDEEDQDGFGGEEVFRVVAVDEPCEHAHYRDLVGVSQLVLEGLLRCAERRVGVMELTSVMIWKIRRETKIMANNMMAGIQHRVLLKLVG